MSISNRYGVDEKVIQKMIKDGVLPCSVVKFDEIISIYRTKIESGCANPEAVKQTSEETNVSIQYVYRIIRKFQ